MKRTMRALIGVTLLSAALGAAAQKPVTYPAKGQSAAQQSKDDGECHAWARQSTGVDPAAPAGAASAQAAPPSGGVVRGAVIGATVGAIGGNDVGNAAAKGAVIGGVHQAARRRGQAEAQQAQAQQSLQTYYRAYGACMSGRGYSVN